MMSSATDKTAEQADVKGDITHTEQGESIRC